SGMPFVSERWLGGTLTNYRTIRNRLKRLQELEAMWLAAGENPNRVDLNAYMATMMTEAGKLDFNRSPDTSDIRTHSKKMVATLPPEQQGMIKPRQPRPQPPGAGAAEPNQTTAPTVV